MQEERSSGSRPRLPLQPSCGPARRLRRASEGNERDPKREEPVVHGSGMHPKIPRTPTDVSAAGVALPSWQFRSARQAPSSRLPVLYLR